MRSRFALRCPDRLATSARRSIFLWRYLSVGETESRSCHPNRRRLPSPISTPGKSRPPRLPRCGRSNNRNFLPARRWRLPNIPRARCSPTTRWERRPRPPAWRAVRHRRCSARALAVAAPTYSTQSSRTQRCPKPPPPRPETEQPDTHPDSPYSHDHPCRLTPVKCGALRLPGRPQVTVSQTKYGASFRGHPPRRTRPPQSARILYDAGGLYTDSIRKHPIKNESSNRDLYRRLPVRRAFGPRFPLRNLELLLAAGDQGWLLAAANHAGYPFG